MKSEGKKKVTIRTSLGFSISALVRYYRRHYDRRRSKRKRRKRQAGLYAGLVLLGIHERSTPLLSSEVGMLTALLGSLSEAQEVLVQRGVELNVKTLRLLAYRSVQRARMMQQMGDFGFGKEESLKGMRVVVSSDGGRVRLREKKRGPKTRKGRNRYNGVWREPKLLLIYVVDAEGKQSQHFAPVMDGVIRGPDAFFALLGSYLRQLDVQEVAQLLFISDGATWIWNRAPALIQSLGIDSSRVHFLLDFYHATEHLNHVASLRKGWTAKERKRWFNKQRKSLLQGKVDKVIGAVSLLCRGRHSRAIRIERNYFRKHRQHMAYDRVAAMKLPIGSGSMESAIRRVVNLRLKGPSTFWCKENAEAVLMMRSYFKAGRWHNFCHLANSHLFLLAS
jgi:hypothetical protein